MTAAACSPSTSTVRTNSSAGSLENSTLNGSTQTAAAPRRPSSSVRNRGVHSATGIIRSEVGRQTGIKHTPSITFEEDKLPEGAKSIEDLVARARMADAELAAARAGAVHAGDPDPYRKPDEAQDEEA